MNDNLAGVAISIGVILVLVLFLYVGMQFGRNEGYKEGQVDCINRKINFVLEEKANKEQVWTEKKKEK